MNGRWYFCRLNCRYKLSQSWRGAI